MYICVGVILGYRGDIEVLFGLYWSYTGNILGIRWNNGKETGNY